MLELVIVAALAYTAGAFTPAVGRKIKAYFVKESAVVKTELGAELNKAEAAVAKKV